MSEPRQHESGATRLVRAAIPGRPSSLARPASAAEELWAPGRASLEWSILFAALAMLVPAAAVASAALAVRAGRAGHPRWLAAAIASAWCLFLGVMVRGAAGLPVLP